MVLSMFTVCEPRVWQWVKQLSRGQDGDLMLAETYGWTPWPNPAAPQSQVGDVKCCHLEQRTSLHNSSTNIHHFLSKAISLTVISCSRLNYFND